MSGRRDDESSNPRSHEFPLSAAGHNYRGSKELDLPIFCKSRVTPFTETIALRSRTWRKRKGQEEGEKRDQTVVSGKGRFRSEKRAINQSSGGRRSAPSGAPLYPHIHRVMGH